MNRVQDAKALTFDLFGTILDLGGSLRPHIEKFLTRKGVEVSADRFWYTRSDATHTHRRTEPI